MNIGVAQPNGTNIGVAQYEVAAGGGEVKTVDSVALASVKTKEGLAIGSVKKVDGVSTT